MATLRDDLLSESFLNLRRFSNEGFGGRLDGLEYVFWLCVSLPRLSSSQDGVGATMGMSLVEDVVGGAACGLSPAVGVLGVLGSEGGLEKYLQQIRNENTNKTNTLTGSGQ